MTEFGRAETFIGLDIGRVNTRVSVFGVSDGKYRLQACAKAQTDYGYDGHLAAGIQEALGTLETTLGRQFLRPSAGEIEKVAFDPGAVEQVGLSLSAFPPIKAALFGLAGRGSLAAGLELVGKLPLEMAGAYGAADLVNEPAVLDALLDSRPEILILTGGTDSGAESLPSRWIEVSRLLCRALPDEARPRVFYAGNPDLHPLVRRRLEPVCRLSILPNLQPCVGERDDVPAQAALGQEILELSRKKLPGLQGISQLTGDLVRTRGLMLDRMVRFFSRTLNQRSPAAKQGGVLAVDLGAGCTGVSARREGRSMAIRRRTDADLPGAPGCVYSWTAAPTGIDKVEAYLANQQCFPGRIPQTLAELAMSQSLARGRLDAAMQALAESAQGVGFDPQRGLFAPYEMVIASGSALTEAPTRGQAMLILLDGLQPWQETRLVLDRYQILPVLGVLGETEPLIPAQALNSDAFEHLGTVIPVVSPLQEGVLVLSVQVSMDSGKSYQVDIPQGALRRLLIPAGDSVNLTLDPAQGADVGLGPGVARQTRVTGGTLGVVIDARGRPLKLPEENDARIEQLRHWLWSLGG